MKITFRYDEDKDIECLLSKGPGSINSPQKPTKTYQSLIQTVPDLRDKEKVREFVRSIRSENMSGQISVLQKSWDSIHKKYEERAEEIFGIKIDSSISAYLTITGRYPYSIEEKYFFVSAEKTQVNATCMHELWHFYTWQKFGSYQSVIGPEKYNELKEVLTVLLNIEFADLMEGEIDKGYPQHQELRAKIIEQWKEDKDIEEVWKQLL